MASCGLANNISVASSVLPQNMVDGTAVTSTGVDLQFYESASFCVHVGAITTGDTVTISFQDSDDNSTFAAVTTANMIGGAQPGALDAGSSNSIIERGYLGDSRYVKVVVTSGVSTGNTTGIAGFIVRGNPIHAPVT